MNQKSIWIIIILLVIIFGYALSQKSNKPWIEEGENIQEQIREDHMVNDDKVIEDENSMMNDMEKSDGISTDDSTEVLGTYELYDKEKLIKARDGDVVLFFRATWCPTCRALDTDIRKNLEEIPANLTILDVDYDRYGELKKKYNVTYQHTFVQVDEEGNVINKWSGSPTLEELIKEVK